MLSFSFFWRHVKTKIRMQYTFKDKHFFELNSMVNCMVKQYNAMVSKESRKLLKISRDKKARN